MAELVNIEEVICSVERKENNKRERERERG
jgi:hypothetical protein